MRFLWIRKTGAAVRWLPIRLVEQNDGQVIQLPCPVTDLIRLASVCADHESDKRLHQLLRLNPTLLLFALANYQNAQGSSPDSAGDLMAWSRLNLIGAIGCLGVGFGSGRWNICSRKRFQVDFEKFLRARNNRQLSRSLQRFLRLNCGLDKSTCKAIVARLVGRNLRADQFKCKQVRRTQTHIQAVDEWFSRIGFDLDVAGLIDLAESKLESTARFAVRLQEEKLASMKQLAYGASHEINNPLANIATRSQTLLANEADPEKRHKLSVIYEQAIRAHEMISDMMLFAHPPALNLKSVSIRLLMARIVHEMKPDLATVPEIDLKVWIGAGVDKIEVDPNQFSVAIKNLVQNSIEALRGERGRNPTIEIRLARSESPGLSVSIWDNGPGISDEVIRHMFDPFYSGREAGRGLGFGLSKVWTIAKLHGGSLQYDEWDKTGTTFVVFWPFKATRHESGSAPVLTICQNEPGAEDEAA